jgi:hypothetical protein
MIPPATAAAYTVSIPPPSSVPRELRETVRVPAYMRVVPPPPTPIVRLPRRSVTAHQVRGTGNFVNRLGVATAVAEHRAGRA